MNHRSPSSTDSRQTPGGNVYYTCTRARDAIFAFHCRDGENKSLSLSASITARILGEKASGDCDNKMRASFRVALVQIEVKDRARRETAKARKRDGESFK